MADGRLSCARIDSQLFHFLGDHLIILLQREEGHEREHEGFEAASQRGCKCGGGGGRTARSHSDDSREEQQPMKGTASSSLTGRKDESCLLVERSPESADDQFQATSI